MTDALAVVKNAVFDKYAGDLGKTLDWSKYTSNLRNLDRILDKGDRMFLATARSTEKGERLWLVGVYEQVRRRKNGWHAKDLNRVPVLDITHLRSKFKFESGNGLTDVRGKLGQSLQTPRALTVADVELIEQELVKHSIVLAKAGPYEDEDDDDDYDDDGLETEPPNDLNVIFYGPPGTGKTHYTAEYAVGIIDGEVPQSRGEVMVRYRQLRLAGLIEMVTFHQSYSYEEFVEGIRPALVADEGADSDAVAYECRDGVFRRVCKHAMDKTIVRHGTTFDPAVSRVWKISLGNTLKAEHEWIYDECIEQGQVVLGYTSGLDFSGCENADDTHRLLMENEPDLSEAAASRQRFVATAIDRFKNKIDVGDLMVVSDGNRKFRAIGKVTGEYKLLSRPDFAHSRAVEWLYVAEDSASHEQIMTKSFSQASLYQLRPSVLKLEAFREVLAGRSESEPAKPHVLIIDEINRGNVAKILGELITLIEPDKRLGATNELTVTLPYSGDSFGVPANLYIVGTMNTADRSLALLDTALRRRFRFREMSPNADVLIEGVGDDGDIDGVNVAELMDLLNKRIEVLYDREHTLGHSLFIDLESLDDLRDVFLDDIIPLLQEYFYDDWRKIGWVLGCDIEAGTNQANAMLSSTKLDAQELCPGGDFEDKMRCGISEEFREAEEEELVPYFARVFREPVSD